MKFKKAVIVNINKDSLRLDVWKRIDKVIDNKVLLQKDSPEIIKELKDADCLLVSFGFSVTKEMIDASPNLKYVGILATAFGKVDTAYAKKKKVIVSNLAGYSTESVAEFVIAVVLENIRGLEEGKARGRSGNVSEEGISAFEIKNKTFGVIGLGNIGGRVAEIAKGFGANIIYFSRHKKEKFEKKGFKLVSLETLLKTADIISVNLAQTAQTEKILNSKNLNLLKSGAVMVNTAPMDLVEIKGLAKRLAKNDITFILDHSDEMTKEDLKILSKYSNCIIYPPMAYISKEAAENRQRLFIENIENYLSGKPSNVVN